MMAYTPDSPRTKRGEQGFTLIELIVVIAILGFILSIAIPRYLRAQTNALLRTSQTNAKLIARALEANVLDIGEEDPSDYFHGPIYTPRGESYRFYVFFDGTLPDGLYLSYIIFDPFYNDPAGEPPWYITIGTTVVEASIEGIDENFKTFPNTPFLLFDLDSGDPMQWPNGDEIDWTGGAEWNNFWLE